MSSFFGKLRGNTISSSPMISLSSPSRKDAKEPPSTPLEKLLLDAGPMRNDGSDKFFGMENFGNTCYCNSILQCLYYSVPFREQVINYPKRSPPETLPKNALTVRAPSSEVTYPPNGQNPLSLGRGKPTIPTPVKNPALVGPLKVDDKESPEFKKKQAMLKGPVLPMSFDNSAAYGMEETLFTSLKDIFEAIVANPSRIGVVSPTKFLEVLRKDNEMFRTSMHQDAHEFLNLLLNEVVANVETNAKKLQVEKAKSGGDQAVVEAWPSGSLNTTGTRPLGHTGWVHELFEGTLTSETKCLTCENVSQRDEAFLDLSVDLDSHSSVTSCLRKFSEEEMLCERNKFHCDRCGGLQEAEKRMKIKRLPKVLALHLKRFKYTEDLQRLQKLFHRVVYPYHLRLFNTTDDAEDPDRLYELYAVVVHIGGGPYHGHYVSIIKTPDRGWLLFDDEMVEPVDKDYVRNFFGDQPGLACAYVLFYQETTLEAVKREQEAEGLAAAQQAVPTPKDRVVPPNKQNGHLHPTAAPPTDDVEPLPPLAHATTAPPATPSQPHSPVPPPPISKEPPLPPLPKSSPPRKVEIVTPPPPPPSKKERAKEVKDRKAAEKAAQKAADKDADKAQRNAGSTKGLILRHKEIDPKRPVDVRSAMEARKLSPKIGSDARFSSVSTNGTETLSVRVGPGAGVAGSAPKSPGLSVVTGTGSAAGMIGLGLRTSMASSMGAMDTVVEPAPDSKKSESHMEQARESEKEGEKEKEREREREKEAEKERERERERERQKEKEKEQEKQRERGREKERPKESEVEKESEKEREREKEKEKEREKEKTSTISRFRQTSKSLSRRPKFLGGTGGVAKDDTPTPTLTHMLPVDADDPEAKETRKGMFGLRKKGSGTLLN